MSQILISAVVLETMGEIFAELTPNSELGDIIAACRSSGTSDKLTLKRVSRSVMGL